MAECKYISKDLIDAIPKKYVHLINYCQRVNNKKVIPLRLRSPASYIEVPKNQLTLEKYVSFPPKIDNRLVWNSSIKPANDYVLDEILRIENEKFEAIRAEPNLPNEKTEDIIRIIKNYASKNIVIGETCGLPGSGKSTFTSKYFPETLINVDKYLQSKDEELRKNKNLDADDDLICERILYNSLDNYISDKLKGNNLIVIDSAHNTKNYRYENVMRKQDYPDLKIVCFLFDSHCETCYERMQTRKPVQVHEFSTLIEFLLRFESPLGNDLSVEPGIDLIFSVNPIGEIKSAYPLSAYEKIKEEMN